MGGPSLRDHLAGVGLVNGITRDRFRDDFWNPETWRSVHFAGLSAGDTDLICMKIRSASKFCSDPYRTVLLIQKFTEILNV